MPSFNRITGSGEAPPPDSSFPGIEFIETEPPIPEPPDPEDIWVRPEPDAGAPPDAPIAGPSDGGPRDVSPPAPPANPDVEAERARIEAEQAALKKADDDAYAAQRQAEADQLREQAKSGILLPEKMPEKFDIGEAMDRARDHIGDPIWFYNMVKTGGEWDWKTTMNDPGLEDFGNMFFGAVGRAFGLPEEVLKRGAGWFQEHMGDTGNPNWGSFTDNNSGPYGDDPVDQFWIEQGSRIYEANVHANSRAQ